MYDRYFLNLQQEDYRAALIVNILYNVNRGDNPPREESEWFSSLQKLKKKENEGEVLAKRMKQNLARAKKKAGIK